MIPVTVIGAGIYGCLTALELSRFGFQVTLVDRQSDIFMGATRANHGRLHRGYHYPRSGITMLAASRGYDRWRERFPITVHYATSRCYALADESSLTWDEYRDVCRGSGLEFNGARTEHYPRLAHIRGHVYVEEGHINVDILRDILRHELFRAGVRFRQQNVSRYPDGLGSYLVDCTYGQLGWAPESLEYEMTELVIAKLPHQWENRSVVVMDGPFGVSVDPVYWNRGLHYLYHVKHSVRGVAIGAPVRSLRVDSGPLQLSGADSAFHDIVREGSRYIPDLKQAQYVESLVTQRAILASARDTDARPSRMWNFDDNRISVLGGKIGDAIATAEEVAALAQAKWL